MQPIRKQIIDYALPILGTLLVLLVCLHMAVAYVQVKDVPRIDPVTGQSLFNAQAFFNILFDRLENKPADMQYEGNTTLQFLAYGVGFILFVWAYIYSTRKKLIPGKEFGTAAWGKTGQMAYLAAANQVKLAIREIQKKKKLGGKAKKKKIAAVKAKYIDSDILLTKTEKFCMYNREINNNILIIGGSGSGKTRSYVLPNILQAQGSYVITDPKGEIFHKSAFFLERMQNYKIRVLNLDVMGMSDGYNPFHYIHMDRAGWEERVLTLIETIILNTDGGERRHSNDPFWEKAERLFLQALFFAVLQAYEPEKQTMNTVLKLMGDLQLEDENDAKNSRLDQFFDSFAEKYGADHIAVQQYREFRDKASGRTAKSIVITASARLSPFRITEVRRIFSYDNMRLDRVGEEKTAIFVIVPPTNKTFSFVAGMLFTQLFQELNNCALNTHRRDGQQLPVPCRFILDEFANTCVIPNFVQILAYARSLGIGITTILQSLEQIKKMYKEEWGVVIDNSNSLLYLGSVSHVETLEYLSKSLGKATFDKKDYSRSRGLHGSSTTSSNRIGRELLMPDEIRNLKKNTCLLLVTGKSPFYSQKINLKLHKNYKFTSEADSKYIIDYQPEMPPQPPKEVKPVENERPKESAPGGGAMDGLDESLDREKVVLDIRPDTVLGVANMMRQSGSASFDGVGMDEDEQAQAKTITEINSRVIEERKAHDRIIDIFVGVSDDAADVSAAMGGLAEGEALGTPTTFCDTTYHEDGSVPLDEDGIIGSIEDFDIADYETADYAAFKDNNTTLDFKKDLDSLITAKLAEGVSKNTKEAASEKFSEPYEAAL